MRTSHIVVSIFLIFFLSLFVFQKINLTTADLGRHIENGELLVHADSVGIAREALLHTNFFSYTNPDFPFVNHHWGSGILLYVCYYLIGFGGLSLLYGGSLILAVLVLFYPFREKIPLWISGPIILFLIPLIAERTEVRPEGFSYLLLAIITALLYAYTTDSLQRKWLWAIPVIALFFVNMHIYFIFVPFIIGMFLLEALLRGDFGKSKWLGIILGISSFVLLVNPYGLGGVLYPFTIFNNYGYLVVENQSIKFLENYGLLNPNFLWWKVSTFFLAIGTIGTIWKYRKNIVKKFPTALVGVSITFAILSFLGIRHFTMYGLTLVPLFLTYAEILYKKPEDQNKTENHIVASFGICILLVIMIFIHFSSRLPWSSKWGFGLEPEINASAEFFKKENIKGPVFSNYDIGGYLIFHLYPNEKVFADNRPEAYPAAFFENEYKKMQLDDAAWKEELKKWNFNAIYFYYRDLTPWAQKFLITRISDPTWAPVYVDNYTLIFLRRNEQNENTIKKYELPKNIFNTTQP